MVKSRSAEWQEAYQNALCETDQEKFMTKILPQKSPLFSRLQQMHKPISKDEVIAIYHAAHALRILSYDLYTREKREHSHSNAEAVGIVPIKSRLCHNS
jgi:hypothetical protein